MNILSKSASGTNIIPSAAYFLEKRVIFLEGEVNSESVIELQKAIAYLASQDKHASALLVISSPGGSIQSGLSLYSAVASAPFKVDTLVMDEAASMGAVLSICTTGKRYMFPTAKLFLHQPLVKGIKDGSLDGVKEVFKGLEKAQIRLNKLISVHSGLSDKDVKKYTSCDIFFDFEEAKKLGFVDEVGSIDLLNNYEI